MQLNHIKCAPSSRRFKPWLSGKRFPHFGFDAVQLPTLPRLNVTG